MKKLFTIFAMFILTCLICPLAYCASLPTYPPSDEFKVFEGTYVQNDLPRNGFEYAQPFTSGKWVIFNYQKTNTMFVQIPADTEYLNCASNGIIQFPSGSSASNTIWVHENDSWVVDQVKYFTPGGQIHIPSTTDSHVLLYSNVPIRKNGEVIFNPTTPASFDMTCQMYGNGVLAFSTTTTSDFPPNTSFDVQYYLISSEYGTPNYGNDFMLDVEYVGGNRTYIEREFDWENEQLFAPFYNGKFGWGSNIVPSVTNTSFDISDYPISEDYGGGILTNASGQFEPVATSVDCNLLYRMRNAGGIYSKNDVAMIAVIHDSSVHKWYICRQDFTVSDIIDSLNQSFHAPSSPEPTEIQPAQGINTLQDLADYLTYCYNTTNNNNWITYNYTSSSGGDWASLITPLSGELDTMFNGLMTDFCVPTDQQINDLQNDIDAETNKFKSKFGFVDDIKTEMYFVSSTIRSAGEECPVYKCEIGFPGILDTAELIFFDGSWIPHATRVLVKNIITCFCSLAFLLYVFRTLPSTVGSMPTD